MAVEGVYDYTKSALGGPEGVITLDQPYDT